jgi:GTP-binding protein Era
MKILASEITREQLFLQLEQELPYKLTVETEKWKELQDGSIRVDQIIIVSRESYKKMIVGSGGQRIKTVGLKARQNIESTFDCKVHLFLFVKVRKNWDTNPYTYSYMGLKYEKF